MQSLPALPADLNAMPLAILETVDDPVQVLDRNFRVVWSNRFSTNGHLWEPKDLVGRICHWAFFQRQTPCPDCPLREAFASGQSQVRDKMIPLPDGSYQWRRVHSYPVKNHDGSVELVIKMGFDITPHKRREGRREKYLAYLESSLRRASEEAGPGPGGLPASSDHGLTQREREVLGLLAQGFSNPEIAQILAISPHTIKTHLAHIFQKLAVNDRVSAALWAVRQGLV